MQTVGFDPATQKPSLVCANADCTNRLTVIEISPDDGPGATNQSPYLPTSFSISMICSFRMISIPTRSFEIPSLIL